MKPCRVSILALVVLAVWVGSGSARDVEALAQDLRTGDEATRVRAILALGQSDDPRAVEVLREALNDESQLVRKHALQALNHLLLALEHTSRLVARWLQELRERVNQRLGEPPVIRVRRPIYATSD
jgi:HEAT repeat protein